MIFRLSLLPRDGGKVRDDGSVEESGEVSHG